MYERNKQRVFRNIPRNLAHREGYYTIHRADGSKDDKFERLLATDIEGPGIPVLRKLSSGTKQLKWQEIAYAASFIAMQELRVPYMRDQLTSVMLGAQEHIMNFALSVPGYLEHFIHETRGEEKDSSKAAAEIRDAVRSGNIKLAAQPEASLKALGYMLPILIEAYSSMKWTVFISENQAFVTSDAPVCRNYPETSSVGAGLLNRDLEVYFPISHNRALLLIHDHAKQARLEMLQRQKRNREAQRLVHRTPEITYRHLGKGEADRINKLIIERALRWIYSPLAIEYVTTLFVGETRNVRMKTDFIEGANLIRLTARFG